MAKLLQYLADPCFRTQWQGDPDLVDRAAGKVAQQKTEAVVEKAQDAVGDTVGEVVDKAADKAADAVEAVARKVTPKG